eukprot:3776324-Pleurochrysis_carterae.AAC.1
MMDAMRLCTHRERTAWLAGEPDTKQNYGMGSEVIVRARLRVCVRAEACECVQARARACK